MLNSAQFEDGHCSDQLCRLVLQALRCSGAFFHQRRVLLRGLIELVDGLANLGHAGALLRTGGADLADDIADACDRCDDLLHGLTGLVHQDRALLDLIHTRTNE